MTIKVTGTKVDYKGEIGSYTVTDGKKMEIKSILGANCMGADDIAKYIHELEEILEVLKEGTK